MRKLVVVITCILVSASLASAQIPTLGVYADMTGSECNILDVAPGLLPVYVVSTINTGSTGCQFAAPVPGCMTATFLSDTSPFPIVIGDSQNGVAIGFGMCHTAPINVLTINYFGIGTTPDCCEYTVIPAPGNPYGEIEFVDCDFNSVFGIGITNTVNGNAGCPCGEGPANNPPVAVCHDVTVVADSTCTADASIDNGSYDPDGDPITLTQSPPGPYPLGATVVTLTVEDTGGEMDTCTGTVTVIDTMPADVTLTLNRDVLWPPNHKMADVWITVDVTGGCCSMPTYSLLMVTSTEPDDGKGDGNTTGDIVILSDNHVQLRSERMGNGDGRVYTLYYEISACGGNPDTVTAEVRVPNDKAGSACAATGFGSTGIGFDPQVERFAIEILSRAAVYEIGWDGRQILVQEGFDATALDVSRVYVGNLKGVVLPDEAVEADVDADGLLDLMLYYSAGDVNRLLKESTPKHDGAIDMSIDYGTIGLHYTSATGVDYLVPDIFKLPGAPQVADSHVPETGEGNDGAPKATPVMSAYPNPFNPQTTIAYTLPRAGMVRVTIYDVQGRLMRRLVNGAETAGEHTVIWNGRDEGGRVVSTGIYFVRFEAGGTSQNHKIVFMK